MLVSDWLSENWIEIFGAATGIIYVFLEVRQNSWLWPVGIVTSAVYIAVFFTSKFYADMGLQVYYLVISCIGWYWWIKGTGQSSQPRCQKSDTPGQKSVNLRDETGSMNSSSLGSKGEDNLTVTRLKLRTGIMLVIIFVSLYFLIWFGLSKLTDSPIPQWDSLITSLSIVGTWMLARKIYEHWYVWIAVNSISSAIFLARGLYPTMILYVVYLLMSFAGLVAWKRSL
jgi:nicotinamide mononucleotide transporter